MNTCFIRRKGVYDKIHERKDFLFPLNWRPFIFVRKKIFALFSIFTRTVFVIHSLPGAAFVPHLPRVIYVCPFQGQQASPDRKQHPSNAKCQTLKRRSHQTP